MRSGARCSPFDIGPIRRPEARLARGGFSLAEVAATAVALVVLGGVLLPALGAAARTSKQAVCLNNLGRIGYATAIYSSLDPDEQALPVHPAFSLMDSSDPDCTPVGPYDWGGKSGVGEGGKYGTANGFGPGRRPLNPYLYGELPDFTNDPGQHDSNWYADTRLELEFNHCPSDSGYTGIHTEAFRQERRTAYDHYGTSYVANVLWTHLIGQSTPVWSNSPYLHHRSSIPEPRETIAYIETAGQFAAQAGDCANLGIEGKPGTVRGWHGKDWIFNVAFVDGHADAIYMHGFHPYDPWVGSNEQSADRYQCVTPRGDGWRLDTLPASPVKTSLSIVPDSCFVNPE